MSEQSTLPEVKDRKPRLVPVPETHRESIRHFIQHFLDLYERELNDYRALAMQYRTAAYENEIQFKRHKIATLKGLLSYNETRKKYAKPNRAR